MQFSSQVQDQADRAHNLGKCPDGVQQDNLKLYRKSADYDNWEVDHEIQFLTALRKNRERIVKACPAT